jgi:hypothetical protein
MAQTLSNLPIGSKIAFGKHQINTETAQPIVWIVADKNHSGYPDNSVTLITEKVIDMRAYDGQEWNSNDELFIRYGNIDYRLSNLHQWLNSEGKANEWYTAQHSDDTAPTNSYMIYGTEYYARPGFLYHFTSTERQSILPTTITNQRNLAMLQSFVAKVFLPSARETLGAFTTEDGSTKLKYFESYNARAFPTEQLVSNTLAESSVKPTSIEAYLPYWTRNTYMSDVACVGTTNALTSNSPYKGNVGVRPCINLSATTKVSSTTTDGYYTIESNTVPTISGSNKNLGEKREEFSQEYSVSDTDGDSITVTEYIDDVKIRSYVATSNTTDTFSVKGTTWLKLANGVHTLKIVATDGFSEATRTFTFIKYVPEFVVQRKTAIEYDDRPTAIIVTVVKVIPDEAIFKVEACNNGLDASPAWEDITSRVLSGGSHNFTNTAKTAAKWGINVRVTVDRNGAPGACYITEIGGNFE